MASFKLPLPSGVPHFSAEYDLDGVAFGFEFRWNHVAEQWKVTIMDGEGEILVAGLSLLTGWPLARRLSDARLFKGVLTAVDTTGKDLDPGLNDLGTRVELHYFPAA